MKPISTSLLLLVVVLNSLAHAKENSEECESPLEAFPAEFDPTDQTAQLRYLTDDPVSLDFERINADRENLQVLLKLTKKSGKEMSKLSGRYLNKRLALVADGQVVSSPKILEKTATRDVTISFDSEAGLDAFLATLQNDKLCN